MKLKLAASAIGMMMMAASAVTAFAANGDTLKTVKERGQVLCPGHDGSYLGFAEVDDQGNWKGLDIDFCSALATAIFNDPDAIKITPVSWAQRWPTLQSGEFDIMIKATGATFVRDTELGFQFSRAYYLGTTKVMAPRELGLKTLADAEGGTICVMAGSAQQQQLASYMASHKLNLEPVVIENIEELDQAYYSGRCDTYTQLDLILAISRAAKAENPDDHVMLEDDLALEPLVFVTRQGDDNWVDIANWLLNAVIFAEQEGITSENVAEMKANPPTPEIAKLLGATPGFGTPLGLEDDWAYNVISRFGNYSEFFERNLGQGSPYKIERGMTALWKDGGVLFPNKID